MPTRQVSVPRGYGEIGVTQHVGEDARIINWAPLSEAGGVVEFDGDLNRKVGAISIFNVFHAD